VMNMYACLTMEDMKKESMEWLTNKFPVQAEIKMEDLDLHLPPAFQLALEQVGLVQQPVQLELILVHIKYKRSMKMLYLLKAL